VLVTVAVVIVLVVVILVVAVVVVVVVVVCVYTPCLKKTVQTYFLSELCQISTDCENFWHKDSKEYKIF